MGIINFLKRKKSNNNNNNEIQLDKSPAEIRFIVVKMKDYESQGTNYLDKHYYISNSYKSPANITLSNACQIASYVTNQVLNTNNELSIEDSIETINNLLATNYQFTQTHPEHYNGYFTITQGFDNSTPIATTIAKPLDGVTDLFIVTGNKKLFHQSPLGKRYFEWFNPNITAEDIDNIYQSVNKCLCEPENE